MKKISLSFFCLILILDSGTICAQSDSVRYHDGNFESQYGAAGAYPGTDYMQCVVRFTPPYYPALLTGIRTYFRNALTPAPFRFVVYSDSVANATGPASTSVYISPSPIVNPASGGMLDSAYDYFSDLTSANIVINTGDVYAGATQYSQINGYFGITIDLNNDVSLYNRNWISTNQGVPGSWWQMVNWTFTAGEWGVTAFFTSIPTTIGNKVKTENNFFVYPNPANDELYISIDSQERPIEIILSDESGRGITMNKKSEFISGGRKIIHVDLSHLAEGIYFCKLISSNSVSIKKIVVY